MTGYFQKEESINYKLDNDIDKILSVIAQRYIGENPPTPFAFHIINKSGIMPSKDGRYDINLEDRFKNAQIGQISYVIGKVWSESPKKNDFLINCYGPSEVYLNDNLLFSSIRDECNKRSTFTLELKKGWNLLIIRCKKSEDGFGCLMGSTFPKWFSVDFFSPFKEREGNAGWVFSEPLNSEKYENWMIRDHNICEQETGIRWFPETEWSKEEVNLPPVRRIFGEQKDCFAIAWTKINVGRYNKNSFSIRGITYSPIEVWIDGSPVYSSSKCGNFDLNISLKYGFHDLIVKSSSTSDDEWGFEFISPDDEAGYQFDTPYKVQGMRDKWLYLGPFSLSYKFENINDLLTFDRTFEGLNGEIYWRVDSPNTRIRPYLENELFGRWNYPIGVTPYGLLQTGKVIERSSISKYVKEHILQCATFHKYSLWDAEEYGYPGINNQLVELDALDDCGSFGSAMLETFKSSMTDDIKFTAERIASHMENKEKQERLPDGAFYRRKGNTMWVDDLYMSTPFLARCFKLTGDRKYIDDVVKQFLLYKKYLYIQSDRVMSHVYDFNHDKPTGVPWGRGNGWALFSLSEVLEYIPEDHKDRPLLLDFFKDFSEGILELQGENGLWHQVLTHPDSYEETSCTSMFLYAFARGIRFGWINPDKEQLYVNAVIKAWDGLIKKAIDKKGNVYGVCRGSSYSFSPDYYKYELLTITNDTHGIGIVLLAGIELKKLLDWLKNYKV